ncbi:MAG: tRNA-2-methylthio-N(6)-dimethylallyladenosine synthase [Elusimicrobia bacterium]|nr:tRNA-2-methylthio-N(6)-dimethylallyladenosine synthase [Elusimicrobiota bacterium]
MNFADSDEMGRHMKERGFQPTENEEAADAILVNTCTVRDLAEHKAASFIGRLKEWKMAHPQGLVIVTGCAAERSKDEFKKRFPYIDLIVGAKDIEQFPKELERILSTQEESLPLPELTPTTPNAVVQYVTIMRGCNYNCSYCIVPAVRGREIYLPIEKILAEVADRVGQGAKEIWLLGQTVNSYKPSHAPKPHYDFADLLSDVCAVPGTQRIRFISPHPYYLTDKLIDSMSSNPKVCEHIHLPVQSGSDDMLRKMKRNYTRDLYMRGLERLRRAIPNIAVSTDIIVGFPGETNADFQQTLTLVQEANFDSAYCFQYSPRPGTASAEMKEEVPEMIKEARVNELLALTDSQGTGKAAKLIGTVQEILVEDDKGDGVFRGKTRGAWRARLKSENLKLGDLVQARITGTHSRELHAELI